MKYKLINDIINVVLPPDGVPVRNAEFLYLTFGTHSLSGVVRRYDHF